MNSSPHSGSGGTTGTVSGGTIVISGGKFCVSVGQSGENVKLRARTWDGKEMGGKRAHGNEERGRVPKMRMG